MHFLNAKRLITMAIEHGILQTKDDKVLIYRDAGSDPEKYPEGWYAEDIDDVSQELMDDEIGQLALALTESLKERGVQFVELDIDNIINQIDTALMKEKKGKEIMLFIKVNDLVYVYDSDEILDVLDQGAIAVVEADKFDENDFKS